jgi:hypothetical protein
MHAVGDPGWARQHCRCPPECGFVGTTHIVATVRVLYFICSHHNDSSSDETTVAAALDVLEPLAQVVQGSNRIVEGGILPVLDGLLESSVGAVRVTTCNVLGHTARFESSTPAIWKGNRCRKLVELSRSVVIFPFPLDGIEPFIQG